VVQVGSAWEPASLPDGPRGRLRRLGLWMVCGMEAEEYSGALIPIESIVDDDRDADIRTSWS